MKKIAFFVEGYSEQAFLVKLLEAIFDAKKIAIEPIKMSGGGKCRITITRIKTPVVDGRVEYYILIYDCGGDNNVKSYIRDQRINLLRAGYLKIIGVRDVYPFQRSEIEKLKIGLNWRLPQKDIPIKFILSIMEIEAWFLAEENHYSKIDKTLDTNLIYNRLNWDPSNYNTELFDCPSEILNDVYQLVGIKYVKGDYTIDKLDYANVYFNVNNRVASLKNLIDEINSIF